MSSPVVPSTTVGATAPLSSVSAPATTTSAPPTPTLSTAASDPLAPRVAVLESEVSALQAEHTAAATAPATAVTKSWLRALLARIGAAIDAAERDVGRAYHTVLLDLDVKVAATFTSVAATVSRDAAVEAAGVAADAPPPTAAA